jgi:hypothetical protein
MWRKLVGREEGFMGMVNLRFCALGLANVQGSPQASGPVVKP